jgi:uncharacterized protein (TIGR02246 family)
VCAAAVAIGAQAPADHGSDAAAIAKLLTDYQTAYSSHDAKASAAFYATDGDRRTSDGRVVKGREAIERQLTSDFAGRFKSATVKFDPQEDIRYIGADMAVVDGSAQLGGVHTAGGMVLPPAKYFHTIVVVKRGGNWQILALRNWLAPTTS